jgi:hypothetical protein
MLLAKIAFQNPNLNLIDVTVAMSASLLASVVVYLMYHLFYGSRTIGAGVDRSFIVGGPAITALFLGIQSSIPLSLGLLGALSFVRFRTPVKDSAEIGFLLLLIAASIGAATGTYPIVIILFLIVFLSLSIQALIRNRFSFKRFANLMISMEKNAYSNLEAELNRFLSSQLDSLNMKTMSVMDDRVSLHYQFRKKSDFNKTEFIRKLNSISDLGEVGIFLDSAV